MPGTLAVGLLVSAGEPSARDAFGEEAAEHHRPERNPFTFLQRAAMLEAALGRRERLRIVPMPRPECAWELVIAMFPMPRVWIVPDAGDPFDDAKARWFEERDEAVLRPRVLPTTDGRAGPRARRRRMDRGGEAPPRRRGGARTLRRRVRARSTARSTGAW